MLIIKFTLKNERVHLWAPLRRHHLFKKISIWGAPFMKKIPTRYGTPPQKVRVTALTFGEAPPY